MSTYKVAVCLSGELRTWEYCKESIKDFFEKGVVTNFPHSTSAHPVKIEVDYFTHTWNSDRGYDPGVHITPVTNDAIQSMITWLKPKRHITGTKRDRYRFKEAGIFLDLFQSFYTSVKLKRDYEIENNFEYNVVIKCRFDLLFSSAYDSEKNMVYPYQVYENTIYNDSHMWFVEEANRFNIQDVFFYGSSFSMDRLANVYADQMTRNLSTLIQFNDTDSCTKSMTREDIVRGVSIDPRFSSGGPGVLINDFMHTVYLGNRQSTVPWPWDYCGYAQYTIIRPFNACFDYSCPTSRERMRRVGAKIHYLNFKNPVAIIFDLDGVLVDTNIVHKDSLIKSIKNITGVDASLMISSESMLSTKQKIQNVKSQFGLSDEMCVDVLIEKDRLFLEMIKNIKVDDNVIECLLLIRSRGIRTAIASNSRLININNVLAITGLREYFDVIVSAEEVARPKPMPDILFEVYNRLHIYGNDCIKTLFVEDTDEGARAGEQSMSSVVRVKSPADLTIDKFSKWLN